MFRRARTLALDALFPPRCIGCGALGAFICARCLTAAPRATGDRCPTCWLSLQHGRCRDCQRAAPAFTALRSAFPYTGLARKAVLALKFEGVSALAPLMADEMARVLAGWSPAVDTVVPVPLGWLRRRTRGYNQAELLAAGIARAGGLPLSRHALRRRRQTSPQTRQADAPARRWNIGDAFTPGKHPAAGNVLLVDDVSTTGATLDACARALLGSGAGAVYALTFARED